MKTSNANVLIVDDEESIRVALAALIERYGYTALTAKNGKEALRIVRQQPIDIAFVDVRMPEMNGIDFAQQVQQLGIGTAIIIMSAYGSVEDAKAAMGVGATDYITKPFKSDEVILALTKATETAPAVHLKSETASKRIVYKSALMAGVMKVVQKIARVDSTALIIGESGTGKELLARALHDQSSRRHNRMVCVNCGAIPENLIESELFGHQKGAFTDAIASREGYFAEANGGTLLLDEVGELPLNMQVKLLRVLQESTFRPVGGESDVKVDVRIVAATFRNLEALVRQGQFREDLFYRLNVVPIRIPPLRERTEDILELTSVFVRRNNKYLNKDIRGLTPAAQKVLLAHHWPGNVRELENALERAAVLCDDEYITEDLFPPAILDANNTLQTILDSNELSIKKSVRFLEEELIKKALKKTRGNRTAAAKILEISHRALLYKLKEYGIS